MYRYVFLSTALLFIACRPTPFQVKPIPAKEPFRVEKSETLTKGLSEEQKKTLSESYKKANSPTFGLISGYYRLPKAHPFGAAKIMRGATYYSYIEKIELKGAEHPFAITPLDGHDAQAESEALNELLNMGVKIKEISMSDALAMAEAEQIAVEKKHPWNFSRYLPPSVDLLMSIYRATGEKGPVLVGRVIAKDGQLLAFKVMENPKQRDALGTLILSLFEDTVNRL